MPTRGAADHRIQAVHAVRKVNTRARHVRMMTLRVGVLVSRACARVCVCGERAGSSREIERKGIETQLCCARSFSCAARDLSSEKKKKKAAELSSLITYEMRPQPQPLPLVTVHASSALYERASDSRRSPRRRYRGGSTSKQP